MDQSSDREGSGHTDGKSEHHWHHSLPHDQSQNIPRLRTERHAHTYFAGALRDGISNRAVNTHRGEKQRDAGKDAEQHHHQLCLAKRLSHDRAERLGQNERESRIYSAQSGLDRSRDCFRWQWTAYCNGNEGKILLRQWPIEFHLVVLV